MTIAHRDSGVATLCKSTVQGNAEKISNTLLCNLKDTLEMDTTRTIKQCNQAEEKSYALYTSGRHK